MRAQLVVGDENAGVGACDGLPEVAIESRSQVNRNSVCPGRRRGARGSPANWPRKLMGRLHKAHTGQSRDHPIGAPPRASAKSFILRVG